MKKHALLMLAGGLLAFASCNNPAADSGASQAQIDSMVNARVDAIRAEMTASNDSMINALAQIKADSMMVAMKPGSSVTTTTTRTVKNPKPTTKPTEQPVKQGGIKGRSDQSNTNSGGIRSHSDQSQTEQNKNGGGGLRSHSDQSQGK